MRNVGRLDFHGKVRNPLRDLNTRYPPGFSSARFRSIRNNKDFGASRHPSSRDLGRIPCLDDALDFASRTIEARNRRAELSEADSIRTRNARLDRETVKEQGVTFAYRANGSAPTTRDRP